jgi:hypothetical protein
MSDLKAFDRLAPTDFANYPVWEFANDREVNIAQETYMRPVKRLPVKSLDNRVVGTQLTLCDGQQVFGVLGNISLVDVVKTEHFLTVIIFRSSDEKFGLARYHDVDYSQRDPQALASFLGLSVPQIFPIRYDLTAVAIGPSEFLCGSIPANLEHPLSREALATLALA